jgi:hypothetical protein
LGESENEENSGNEEIDEDVAGPADEEANDDGEEPS